jgi:excisionase family DNA binding protein
MNLIATDLQHVPSKGSQSASQGAAARYALLEAILEEKGLELKGIYTIRDTASIFGVSVRTIQDWVRDGKLMARDLPGRGRFLSEDLEQFLQNSVRKHGPATRADVSLRQGATQAPHTASQKGPNYA